MANSIVANRYAKALIGLANEKNVVAEVSKDMSFIQEVCSENREFLAVLSNPIVRHEKKHAILASIFQAKVNPLTFAIMEVLTTKNREGLLLSIADEFHTLLDTQQGIQQAQVSSASALTEEQRAELTAKVAQISGKKAVLTEKINEQLIGGYVLKIGDTQIDTSVRKRLADLRVQLS
jgi:F-type H+-transporting ATPase subunit delta